MSPRFPGALVLGVLAAAIASSQTVPADLQKYLNLTDAQVKSINDLNTQFGIAANTQQSLYYQQQSVASSELFKASPDPALIGAAYAQMEMIRRGYNTLVSQTQSKVGAVLTTDQVTLVSALLGVVRLRPLVSEAACVHLESAGTTFGSIGFASFLLGTVSATSSTCQTQPLPTALTNYLNLTDSQIYAIENAIAANQDYLSRQSLQIQELQNSIKDLTAAQTIDAPALGAAYLAISRIQRDGSSQTTQLTTTVRKVLTGPQQTLLANLDNAASLDYIASEAVSTNILVLPPDLQANSCSPFGSALRIPFPGNIIPTSGISGISIYDPLGGCVPTALERTGDFSSLSSK